VQKPWENSRLLQTLRTQIEHGRQRRRLMHLNAERKVLNRKFQQELKEAREIQQGLMPKSMPQLHGFELSSAWQPARSVSGDYLAAFKLNDEVAALCIADVAGKGLPAALLMSNMQAALKSTAAPDLAPGELCDRINGVMCDNMPLHKFITCFYGVLNVRQRILTFTNAGHNAPILVRTDGKSFRLDEGGRVIGAFPNTHYMQAEIELRPGDRLLLFTDGLTEASNANGEEFGEDGLLNLLTELRHLSANEIQATILKSVRDFCGDHFDDDATLMVVAG